MKFYDLNVRGQDFNKDLNLIKEAGRFGWDYLNLNYAPDDFKEALKYKEELIEEASALKRPVEVDIGINLVNAKPGDVHKALNKYRNKSNYISCLGGDLKLNRFCLESYKLDCLSRPYYKRRDSGMNHVLAKEAVKNNVAVELCFRDVLHNHHRYRANLIAHFKEILMFHRKFKFPLVLTTDSQSLYDIRSTRDIVAFYRSIGFSDKEIYDGFYYYPKKIIEFNRERKNIIVRGVKVVEGADDFSENYDSGDNSVDSNFKISFDDNSDNILVDDENKFLDDDLAFNEDYNDFDIDDGDFENYYDEFKEDYL